MAVICSQIMKVGRYDVNQKKHYAALFKRNRIDLWMIVQMNEIEKIDYICIYIYIVHIQEETHTKYKAISFQFTIRIDRRM